MTGHGGRRRHLARWALGLAAFAAVGVGFARGLVPWLSALGEGAPNAAAPAPPPAGTVVEPWPSLPAPAGESAAVADDRACVRLRRRVAGLREPQPWIGAFAVATTAGASLDTGTTRNADEVALALPRRATQVVVTAAGHRPACVDVPPAGAASWRDLGEVVLEPDATVQLAVRGLPLGFAGTVTFEAAAGQDQLCRWTGSLDGLGRARVAMPSGRAFRWWCHADGLAMAFDVRGNEPELASEQVREIALDVAALPVQAFALDGVSAELLPHLVVGGRRNGATVRLDAGGRGELRSVEAEDRPFVQADDGAVALVASLQPQALLALFQDEVVLRPYEPIVGIALRGNDGALLPCRLGLDTAVHTAPSEGLRAVRIVRRDALQRAPRVLLWSAATGTLAFALPRDLRAGELLVLDARDGTRLPVLAVHPTGARPRGAVAIEVFADDHSLALVGAHTVQPRESIDLLGLAPGVYDFRWRCNGRSAAWLARGVELVRGVRADVDAPWPERVRWTGELRGQPAALPERRFAAVVIDAAGAAAAPIDRDGAFAFELAPDAPLAGAIQLRQGIMAVPATVVGVDAARCHLVLAPPADLRWVDFDVEVPEGMIWSASLQRSDQPGRTWTMLGSNDQRAVLVPHGVSVFGSISTRDGTERTLAWLAADGAAPRVRVAVAEGHWCAVRAAAGTWVAPVGPHGQGGAACEVEAAQLGRVWVPDGSRYLRSGRPGQVWVEGQQHPAAATDLDLHGLPYGR